MARACLAVMLVGCTTQIDVSITSEVTGPLELVEISVTPSELAGPTDVPIGGAQSFPLRFSLRPRGDDPAPVTVVARGVTEGEEVAAVRATQAFESGRTVTLALVLRDPCRIDGDCPPGSTCAEGACVRDDVDAGPGGGGDETCDGRDDDGDSTIDEGACPPGRLLAAGDDHTCDSTPGRVRCWGLNRNGRLGDGTRTSSGHPVGATDVSFDDLTAGSDFTCGVVGGKVSCWGSNAYGQATPTADPLEDVLRPAEVADGMARVAAGDGFACAITTVGRRVQCWGRNDRGQRGDIDANTFDDVPLDGLPAVDLVAGARHACARLANGTARCWGDDTYGQVGVTGTGPREPSLTRGARVLAIAAGARHTCAIVDSATNNIRCWGEPGEHLGDGQLTVLGADQLALGDGFSCVLVEGTAQCWGANESGQLGDGGLMPATSVPQSIADLPQVLELSAGQAHVCARGASEVRCWGSDGSGQLGRGARLSNPVPAVVHRLPSGRVTHLAAADRRTCAVVQVDGTSMPLLGCWGEGRRGRLGDGTSGSHASWRAVALPGDVRELVGGYGGIVARTRTDTFVWGDAEEGRLGAPGLRVLDTPTDMEVQPPSSLTPGGPTTSALGEHHGCVIDDMSVLRCFGRGPRGELGLEGPRADLPTPVAWAMTTWDRVATGRAHTCGMQPADPGSVWCWGDNRRFAIGSADIATTGLTQVTPAGTTAVDRLVAGGRHSCAGAGRNVSCWGDNRRGQLASGGASTATPQAVSLSGDLIVGLSAGEAFSCVSLNGTGGDSTMCWGANDHGQLGPDATSPTQSATPTRVPGVLRTVQAGYDHACAIDAGAQEVLCWGFDGDGALGSNRELVGEPALILEGP